jgi:hypothetical protein
VREKKISYDDLINHLIDVATDEEASPKKRQKELSYATKKLLEMMELRTQTILVSLMTGFPARIFGSILILSCQFTVSSS